MNEEERKQLIDGIKTAIAARLKEAGIDDPDQIRKLLGRFAEVEQKLADMASRPGSIRAANVPNPFASDAFKQRLNLIEQGHKHTGAIALPVGIKGIKALTNLPEAGSTVGFPTQPQRGPNLPPVVAPLTIVDVLPSTPVSSDSYEYVQIRRDNNAGVQSSEGAQKPESQFEADLLTAKIATVAHWTVASKQVLADNAQLSAMISRILAVDAVAKYEDLLLNGNGTTDKIHGLLPQATLFSHSAGPKPDRISECLATMWSQGFIGNVVIMNPLDWSGFETERADGDGQYVAGGWANPAAPTVWRTPVARAASLDAGSALVIDTRFVTLLDREQVNTAVSTEDRDNFIKNLVTLLAELRGGLAVYNMDAVRLVDLAST